MIMTGHQPNYIPWLGFFDKISKCDVFLILDNVQFVYHEFHNRNKIKTKQGIQWLTVPVKEGRSRKNISEILIETEINWSQRHWNILKENYCKAPYWAEYSPFFEETYSKSWKKLIDLNLHIIKGIMNILDIEKDLVLASSQKVTGTNNDMIIAQCKNLGVKTYLSGLGALAYLDIHKFKREGIKVVFQEFEYPTYQQLGDDFVPNLSVVDFLLCAGGKGFFHTPRMRM